MRTIVIIILLLTLSACSSSTKISQPIPRELITNSENGGYSAVEIDADSMETPRSFLNAVSRYLQEELVKRSLLNKDNSLYKITVQVTKFNVNTGASREILGALAGPDEVESTVRVINNKTEQVVGESIVTSHELMALGGQDDIAWMHAEEIADFLTVE